MPQSFTLNGCSNGSGNTYRRELRDYQAAAITKLRQSLRDGHRRPVLQAPTGYGKTVVASNVVRMALEKGRRVVFSVPALSLIDQTLESFARDGIYDVGVIQGQHINTDWSRPVQVASVQTLGRRDYPDCDLVIVDECHRWFKHYGQWMTDKPELPFIGLSATPWTKGLGKWFDDLIISATTSQLIEMGHLSPFRVFAPSHPDLTGVKTVAGDYHEGQLSDAMNKAPLVADVVETWIRRGEERQTLCFAVDRAHAKHLQQNFQAAKVPVEYQDAFTPDDERRRIRRLFDNGDIRVVCNVGTLTTGVDWDVRCIVLARPTKSEILYVQIIGRGLRPKQGEPGDCLVLDHSDTTLRLGFVTDIHHETLDRGLERPKQDKSAALPKECPQCAYLKPPRVSTCPNCGFTPRLTERAVDTEAGDLVEVTGRQTRVNRTRHTIQLRGVSLSLAAFYGQLKAYGATEGYKPGWAANKYREAVGVWPNHYRDAPEQYVTEEVYNWVKARQRAWARGRDRG